MLDTIMPGSAAVVTETIGMFSVWLLGVSMGLTACTVTCLPFMGTWVLGRGGSNRETLTDTGVFLLGRVTAYSLLGGLAGALGMWLTQALSSGIGNAFIGTASIGAGIWLLLPARRKALCGAAKRGAGTPPFLLGLSLSLTPCAPLASLLAVCALSGGTLSGAGYGLMFGLGAALTPLLLLLPLLNLFGARMRESQPWLTKWIRMGAALVLMLIGIRRLWLI
ncbi:MAG: sulfite exporter TauE/SafE family protein [Sulfuricella denitrificans]|nr:sulfite exporter TauE/SafE family protein [Sulfuricella denitrificans]